MTAWIFHLKHFPLNYTQRSFPYACSARSTTGIYRCFASLRVKVVSVGRKTAKEKWAEDAVEELVKRLVPNMTLECIWLKNDEQLISHLMKCSSSLEYKVCLDANGYAPRSSEHFAEFLFDRLEKGGSRLTFVIGGADGLPRELLQNVSQDRESLCNETLSLSPLTFTHKMARLILCEQVYRAVEIKKEACARQK